MPEPLPPQGRVLPARMRDRLIVALDVPSVAEARAIVAELGGAACFYKIGMWLMYQPETNALIDELVAAGKQVFLDCKMYDIGETVRRGIEAVAARGVSFVTVHGDEAIMRAAVAGRGGSGLKIFAVTVLTSLNDGSVHGMGYGLSVKELIALRVRQAVACGIDGVIASASDDPDAVRREGGSEALLVTTPGVRLAGGATHDHQRSADPATAILHGADYLVVGRPILEAADRAAQARHIEAEMANGWKQRQESILHP